MNNRIFPRSPVSPFIRLQVKDGLGINAERWKIAHNYHRKRQNLYYNALFEPGIVDGLGVKVIDPPETALAQFRREQRWIEVQPGVAIDLAGNPIVSAEPVTYRLATPMPIEKPVTVYIVISYVDPESLELPSSDERIVERFRLDERVNFLKEEDIELCRIYLAPGEEVSLKHPEIPFTPNANEIDLCNRHQAQLRPQLSLRIGLPKPYQKPVFQNWQGLLDSLPFLCPTIGADLVEVDLATKDRLENCDLLHITGFTLSKWQEEKSLSQLASIIRPYLEGGGTVFSEAEHDSTSLRALLYQVVGKNKFLPIDTQHSIKRQPFRFGKMPMLGNHEVEMSCGAGVILTSSAFNQAWNDDKLSRQDIRSAQELGINLLYFAAQRRHYYDLLA